MEQVCTCQDRSSGDMTKAVNGKKGLMALKAPRAAIEAACGKFEE